MLQFELKGYNKYKLMLNTYVSDFQNANYCGTNKRKCSQSNLYLLIDRNHGLPYNDRNCNMLIKNCMQAIVVL